VFLDCIARSPNHGLLIPEPTAGVFVIHEVLLLL
jgi:hypothetical protein